MFAQSNMFYEHVLQDETWKSALCGIDRVDLNVGDKWGSDSSFAYCLPPLKYNTDHENHTFDVNPDGIFIVCVPCDVFGVCAVYVSILMLHADASR